MGFYTPISKSKNSNFRYKTDYQKNPNNLDGNREDLFDEFWNILREHRTFHAAQEEIFKSFFEDKKKYIFLRIGRKGAKTATNIAIAWAQCLLEKNSTCYIILPTISQGIEIYWDEKRLQWCDLNEPVLADKFVKTIDKSNSMITFVNGSTIKIIGTWSEKKGRGTQPNLIIVDEVKDCSSDYLDAMEPNLAAKEDSRCVMSGTPPPKRTHFHEWEERILKNEQGAHFTFSSYINTALPHLKTWLDSKREELILAKKEDVWLREYMAEDCFSSDERVLPDIIVEDHDEVMRFLKATDPTVFQPIIGITLTTQKLSACYAVTLQSRFSGIQFWILETETESRLWDKSYEDIYKKMEEKMNQYSNIFPKKWRKVIYDETESFYDIIHDVSQSRKDLKWKNRGIPLLKEMLLNGKTTITTKADQFAYEAQNLLKEDNILDYPTVCTLAMLANEYYQAPALSKDEQVVWDQFAPLRENGIICYPPKKKSKSILSINWN